MGSISSNLHTARYFGKFNYIFKGINCGLCMPPAPTRLQLMYTERTLLNIMCNKTMQMDMHGAFSHRTVAYLSWMMYLFMYRNNK